MWIALDVIVIAILVFSVIGGYRKGFIKTAFGFGILIASLILSYYFSPAISSYARTTKQYVSLTQSLKNNVVEKFSTEASLNKEESSATTDSTQIDMSTDSKQASELMKVLSDFGIDLDFSNLHKEYNDLIDSGVESTAEALDKVIIQPVSVMLCNALCFVVVFIASLLALNLLKIILELIFKLPLLKGMNKSSGAIFGVLFGILKVFAFCTVFQILLPYIKNAEFGITLDIAEKTYLYSLFLEINPLKFLY